MATHDEHDTVVRIRPKSSLIAEIGKAAATRQPVPDAVDDAEAATPARDDLIPLPQPGDGYKAHARPDNKALLTLRFLLKDSAVEGFSYSDLRRIRLLPSDKPGGGPVLVLRFVEAVIVEVRIEGRHLEAMHNYLGYHRIAWVRELPPGKMLGDGMAAAVTGISIRQVES